MKRILRVMPIMILFLLIIQVIPVTSIEKNNDFFILEQKIMNKNEFIQNGIRLEYETKNKLENEIRILKNNLKKNNYKNIIEKGNSIFINENYKDIEIHFWKEENITKVQISYINDNKNISTLELKKEIEQIQDITIKNIKYFNFIKVKIIGENKQDILDTVKKYTEKNTLEILNINNGNIAKGSFKDGSKFNFANITYDTGEYLILGTPVIFITY